MSPASIATGTQIVAWPTPPGGLPDETTLGLSGDRCSRLNADGEPTATNH